MKLSLFSIIYLFVRIIPIIVFFYFIYQYIIYYDTNTLYFLTGMFITFIFIYLLSNIKSIQEYKKLDIDVKDIPEYCNVFLLTKNGPLSSLPLSQAMFGYILFFIYYILFKYSLINKNLPYLICMIIFIIIDMIWNIRNSCINSALMILSLVLGSAMGLLSAYIIDKNKNTDLTKFQQLDKTKDRCIFNKTTNKFICYGQPIS